MKLTSEIKNLVTSVQKINEKAFPNGNPKSIINDKVYSVCAMTEQSMWDILKKNDVEKWQHFGPCDMCDIQYNCSNDGEELCAQFVTGKMYDEGIEVVLRLTDNFNR